MFLRSRWRDVRVLLEAAPRAKGPGAGAFQVTTCVSCGSPIPDGQGRSCSMCYGDVEYGRDGYYRRWLEEGERRAAEERAEEESRERAE